MKCFAQRLARELGYSPERGSFNNRVVHAFTSFMGPRDARISTYRNGSYNLIFTYLHEAGHAMYASGSSQEIIDAGLWGGIEGGFHEGKCTIFREYSRSQPCVLVALLSAAASGAGALPRHFTRCVLCGNPSGTTDTAPNFVRRGYVQPTRHSAVRTRARLFCRGIVGR